MRRKVLGSGAHRYPVPSTQQLFVSTRELSTYSAIRYEVEISLFFQHHTTAMFAFQWKIFAYDPELDEWQTLENIRIPSDTTFSQALAVKNNGMYLTSKDDNCV